MGADRGYSPRLPFAYLDGLPAGYVADAGAMTHAQLAEIARRWLLRAESAKGPGCNLALKEVGALWESERADTWGLARGSFVLCRCASPREGRNSLAVSVYSLRIGATFPVAFSYRQVFIACKPVVVYGVYTNVVTRV